MRLKPLERQVVVITGATSGIGLATARLAAGRGARVVLAARSPGALHQLVNEIRRHSGSAVEVVADVAREADVRSIADAANEAFGGFDTWVNNAAVSAYGSCTDVTIEDMRAIMDTNFWGMVYGSRVACAHLRQRGGAIVNVGSLVSDVAVPLQGIYSASKHAIKGFTDSLRAELAHDDMPVSVTLIKPAAINTPYAEHAKNYLPDQPTHVPPVYSPRSVARAILYAAEHPAREVVVGAAGKALTLAEAVAPWIVDVFLSRVLLPSMHSGRPPHGRPALDGPTEDLREEGDYPGVVRPSLYTALRTRPGLASALVGAGAAVLMAARAQSVRGRLHSRLAGRRRPNTRESAVRAAQ